MRTKAEGTTQDGMPTDVQRGTRQNAHNGGEAGKAPSGGGGKGGHESGRDGKGKRDAVSSTTADLGLGEGSWGGTWGMMAEPLGEGRAASRKRKAEHAPIADLMGTTHDFIVNAYAKTSQGNVKTALRTFKEFEEAYEGERPRMLKKPKHHGDMEASQHNEFSMCLFATYLAFHELAPSTITNYVSLAKTNLSIGLGFALTTKELELRLPRLLKGIRRMHKRTRKKRLGWRARYERMLHSKHGLPRSLKAHCQKAVRCSLRQGILRAADAMPATVGTFEMLRHATLEDITFEEAPERHISWLVQPAKKSEQQGKTEYVFLPEGDGITDAYTAIKKMLKARQKAFGQELPTEPLFITGDDNRPFTSTMTRGLFKASAKAIGIDEDLLGSHAGRIGGATDMMAGGGTPAMLQISGRWVRATRHHPTPHHDPSRANNPPPQPQPSPRPDPAHGSTHNNTNNQREPMRQPRPMRDRVQNR